MTTLDTQDPAEPTEQEEALYSAIATALEDITGRWRDNEAAHIMTLIHEPLAAIRRQAAADALREQARGLDKQGVFFSTMKLSASQKGDTRSAEIWALRADQSHGDANRLHREAQGIIAEGYEFECAAFSQECETRVPDAGDYCPKHEPEDDEDPRWAE